MPLTGEYEPSPAAWVRAQVETYERTAGREAATLRETGIPIVVLTTRGSKSGKLRKNPVMRVVHDGAYAVVASKGGSDSHPQWYHNLKADPDAVTLQDGAEPFDGHARELSGDERQVWWDRAVSIYPPYADYQRKTDRLIPVFLIEAR
jgi:F420H(2)-dependent quinone reductase